MKITDEYKTLLQMRARRGDLQVVVCQTGLGPSWSEAAATWGSGIVVVPEPNAMVAAAGFQVGQAQFAVTFLVDEQGEVVYRHTRFSIRDVAGLDQIVTSFAVSGTIPEDAIIEHVLWYGDTAPYPEFPLEGLDGTDIWLGAGRPRLILTCGCSDSGQNAVVQSALDTLRAEYPGVEFVWFFPCVAPAAYAGIWEYGRLLDPESSQFAVSLDDYIQSYAAGSAGDQAALRACMEDHGAGWTLALDPGYRLTWFWLLQSSPMVMILDAAGVVAFPPTSFLVNQLVGTIHPQALDELRRVLDTIPGSKQG